MAHHIFISVFGRRQALEKWRGCGGSIKSISVERDPFREKQLLEPLFLIQRRLHPKVRGARQNAFCERQDALYVEFFDRFGVVVNLGERQFLAQFVALRFIARQVDRLRVEKGLIEPVQLLLNHLGSPLDLGRSVLDFRRTLLPDVEHAILHQAHVARSWLQ